MSSPTVLFVLEKIMKELKAKRPDKIFGAAFGPGSQYGNFYFICMINLRQRSYQKELMDGDDIPFEAMAQTLKELEYRQYPVGWSCHYNKWCTAFDKR